MPPRACGSWGFDTDHDGGGIEREMRIAQLAGEVFDFPLRRRDLLGPVGLGEPMVFIAPLRMS